MSYRKKIKIGLVLANPPGYSKTFFRSKIKGLKRTGLRLHFSVLTKKKYWMCPGKPWKFTKQITGTFGVRTFLHILL